MKKAFWVTSLFLLAPGAHPPAVADVAPAATATPMTQPAEPSLFDPARHMRVSEVRPGMTGYGLTVFSGSKIERFDVVVVSVLKNFNTQDDVVLIRCKGALLEHSGSIAGMSGSPVYLHDDQGRDRMIGAFAYGWPLAKDPLAGVQPIEYMLALPTPMPTAGSHGDGTTGGMPPSESPKSTPHTSEDATWSMSHIAMVMRGDRRSEHGLLAGIGSDATRPANDQTGETFIGDGRRMPHLEPLTTPIMTSGLSPQVIKTLSPTMQSLGLTLLQSGGGSSDGDAGLPLKPGSVLAVPLLTGDADLTAIGTVTEVIGDRMFGFGHPFNSEGHVSFPIGGGEIQGIVANLQTSFKLGSMSNVCGTLTTDQSVGVAGRVGPVPATVSMDFHVTYADGSRGRKYHFNASQNAKMIPMLAGIAFSSALTGPSELPQYNTVDYDLTLNFSNGKTLNIHNRAANAAANDLLNEIGVPVTVAQDNPFQRVSIKSVSGEVRVSPTPLAAELLDITITKEKYHPGETIKGFATYKPFRGDEETMPIEMELPRDLPKGTYRLIISDAQRFVQDEQQSQPFQFNAQSIGDIFNILSELVKIQDNAVYLRLVRQPDGVAIGRTALQKLPTSRRQILLGAGRSETTAFVSSSVKILPTEDVMSGSAEFAITIDTSPIVTSNSEHADAASPPMPKKAAVK